MIKKLLVPRSLNVRMLLSQLLAAVCAVLVFLGVSTAGVYAVENIYMSRANVGARQAAIYAELSRYVKQNGIEGSDAAAVDNWAREQGSVNIQVFPDELSESDSAYLRAQTSPQYGRIYPMIFADGRYRISIEDTSEDREIFLCDILALLLGAITYSIIQLVYTGKLTRRIVALSREAAEVSAGDLEKPITAKGEDEIAAVAQDMDTMRRSVIERMSNEKRAWEANSELITAISHDIRTPMTSLLGYLGLLNAPELPEAERGQYTASAYAKAMELKDLTDELFRYFLVFGRSDLELNMEPYDAQLLLEQLLGEAEFDLREAGFDVQRSGEAIAQYLESWPSIRIVFDIHRDALGSDGVVYKTMAEEEGTVASQLMLLVGTDASGLEHPNWRSNLALALYLQEAVGRKHPTLMRPVTLVQQRYNQHLTAGSLILEVGSSGNTLQEALAAIRLFADGAAPALLALTEGEENEVSNP